MSDPIDQGDAARELLADIQAAGTDHDKVQRIDAFLKGGA